MRLRLFAIVMSLIFCVPSFALSRRHYESTAQGGPFGLGIVLGGPTAITGKYWLDHKHAIDAGVGALFGDYFMFYGDYLFHYPGAFGHDTQFVSELTPYFGFGGVMAFTTDNHADNSALRGKSSGALGLGGRVPVGIEWRPSETPIGVFLELAPGLSLIPQFGFIIEGGIGIRYYF